MTATTPNDEYRSTPKEHLVEAERLLTSAGHDDTAVVLAVMALAHATIAQAQIAGSQRQRMVRS